MLTRFFVGLTFDSQSILAKKIDGFRRRFDPKYNSAAFPHMSLLAPFDVPGQYKEELAEELADEIDNFFIGQGHGPKLELGGIDVHATRKKHILYLNPHFSADMLHCMESICEISESYIPRGIKYKRNKKQFLPLGSFHHIEDLSSVLTRAIIEFTSHSELPITGISLFEKKWGVWVQVNELISFEEDYREGILIS